MWAVHVLREKFQVASTWSTFQHATICLVDMPLYVVGTCAWAGENVNYFLFLWQMFALLCCVAWPIRCLDPPPAAKHLLVWVPGAKVCCGKYTYTSTVPINK